eukprot:12021796-Prorocentrum_lima.AAC.1
MDMEKYKELKDHLNQDKVKHTELRGTLADLRKTPSLWNNVDLGGTPAPTSIIAERIVPVMAMATSM